MLKKISAFYGDRLAATDGEIGHVKDFYFDDESWAIRYAVVNTGTWLTGRHILIPTHVLGKQDSDPTMLRVDLRKAQIENSPSLEVHAPVSRPYEMEYYRYFGWPPYWRETAAQAEPMAGQPPDPGHHLQSTQGMTGYHVHGTDGMIGRVHDLLVDDQKWAVRELVVEAGPWHRTQAILISPAKVERIGFAESEIYVSLGKRDVQRVAEAAGANS